MKPNIFPILNLNVDKLLIFDIHKFTNLLKKYIIKYFLFNNYIYMYSVFDQIQKSYKHRNTLMSIHTNTSNQ